MHARRELASSKVDAIERHLQFQGMPDGDELEESVSKSRLLQTNTDLSNDQELRELGKAHDLIKQLLLLRVIRRTLDELQGVLSQEEPLIALLLLIALA